MKLFYSPGACSLASHITLHELGLPFEAVKVDLKKRTTSIGAHFDATNAKGYVPALQFDDGELLTEGPAILQYLADLQPGRALAPAAGTLARYRLQEWLGFINSEVHKAHAPFFHGGSATEQQASRLVLSKRYAFIEAALQDRPFLTGDGFTVADAYLFTVLSWIGHTGLDIAGWPRLQAYRERIAARPAVRAAQRAEELG